jgi:hypothetical protein
MLPARLCQRMRPVAHAWKITLVMPCQQSRRECSQTGTVGQWSARPTESAWPTEARARKNIERRAADLDAQACRGDDAPTARALGKHGQRRRHRAPSRQRRQPEPQLAQCLERSCAHLHRATPLPLQYPLHKAAHYRPDLICPAIHKKWTAVGLDAALQGTAARCNDNHASIASRCCSAWQCSGLPIPDTLGCRVPPVYLSEETTQGAERCLPIYQKRCLGPAAGRLPGARLRHANPPSEKHGGHKP